jgi:hypothetical protein
MSARPKSVGFIAGIAVLQGILAIALARKEGVAPAWAASSVGHVLYLGLAGVSILLGVALLVRDDAARVGLLWLQTLLLVSSTVTLALLIHHGTLPGRFLLLRMLWGFLFGTAALWTLAGPNAMEFFGAGSAGRGGNGHGSHASH